MPHVTLGGMVLSRIEENPDEAGIRAKIGGTWTDISWREMGERMARIAAGLMTGPGDVTRGDTIAILANTRTEWILLDFAAQSIGLRTVPVYATLLVDEVGYLHVDTDAILTIVEDGAQLEKVREMRRGFKFFEQEYGAERVKLRHIVVIDTTGVAPADDWESLADLEARGAREVGATAARRAEWLAEVTRDDVATWTYTSGTTGPPKAVIQTHGNMLSMCESVGSTGLFGDDVRAGGLFLFLPLAHSFGRLIELGGPFTNTATIISSIPTLLDDLLATRPGFFPAAPRVFEKMKARIEGRVAGAPPIRQALFKRAMAAGHATIAYRSRGQPLPFGVQLAYGLADKIVLSKLRAALGLDRAAILLSGSAPLNQEVHEFFMSMGLDLLEAYGLTETCPGLTANLIGAVRLGTVGRPLPGVSIKIAPDGEILAKGPNITSGYRNRPDATAEAFDDEGWFCTGDLGSQDGEGFVKITGRKKELMKTSFGKFIAPAKLEGRLKNHPLVQEAVTVADTYNYVTALLAIDPDELTTWATRVGTSAEDLQGEALHKELQQLVNSVNETLAQYETIKYFTVVPAMTVESGLLTASLKVKRKPVYERYAAEIADMYSRARPD